MTEGPLPADFDPGAAADQQGLFGLPCSAEQSRVVIVPVPWEATASYHTGTAAAPMAILLASRQVDLFDVETGRPYEQGIAMLEYSAAWEIEEWSTRARRAAVPVIEAGGPGDDLNLKELAWEVDDLCERMNAQVRANVEALLELGKLVFVLGGDHSVPFGAIQAHAARFPGLGILHFDAHYDLRPAYEGFTWSHASIMHNVLEHVPDVGRIVHVGVRDFCEDEHRISAASGGVSVAYLDVQLRDRLGGGETWKDIAAEIVEQLPRHVYVSFDIDGLDPTLCPGTGTPVPGGLSWHEATSLLAAVVRSGRRIVGGDLVEVCPLPADREWNANVGARLLYKLIGYALQSQAGDG